MPGKLHTTPRRRSRGILLTILTAGCLLAASPAIATAESLSGTVTGPLGPLPGICVSAEGPAGSGIASPTDIFGNYAIDVAPGSGYIVHFVDCDTGAFENEYYDNAATIDQADPVTVAGGVGVSGINAQLALRPPDTTDPETSITDGPDGLTNSRTARFEFEGNEPISSFECKLDAGAWEACSSPREYLDVPDGDHHFEVRATDVAGNTDDSPAFRNFTVDATPPETTINSGPSGTVSTTVVTFTFSSSKSGPTFFCKMDDDEPAPCTSPHQSEELANGSHQFSVFAQDGSGNTDTTPATRIFTVDDGSGGDVTPPQTTIDSGPSGTISSTSAEMVFHSSEPGSTFQCRIDSGLFEECDSPRLLTNLSDDSHVFRVFAADASGNVDPTPAEWFFSVDTTVPETTITDGPTGTIPTTSTTVTFESDEASASFECKLDGGNFEPCFTPWDLNNLAAGDHHFEVRAYDNAGNRDASPDARDFTVEPVDADPPDTFILSGPSGTITSSSTSFTFDSTEAGSTFECKIDAGSFAPCTSPRNYSLLGDGSHTFQVRAVDAAANRDPNPATQSFSVQTAVVNPPPGDPDPQANPECLNAQAALDQAQAVLTKAKAKLKKAKSRGAKKKAKAKVKKASAQVKSAAGAVSAACS